MWNRNVKPWPVGFMCFLKPEGHHLVCFYIINFDVFITHIIFLLHRVEMKTLQFIVCWIMKDKHPNKNFKKWPTGVKLTYKAVFKITFEICFEIS